jgi:multiple sugar transport system substrate-binding protein
MPDLYGAGQVGGTIIGIPKGVKHPAESWLLVKYMSTDVGALTTLARGLRNVPSTNETLEKTDLASDPKFKTFIEMVKNPKSTYKPLTPIGDVDEQMFGTFAEKWQAGKVPDLQAGLQQLDSQIAKQLQLG